jgi:hypothetical protein
MPLDAQYRAAEQTHVGADSRIGQDLPSRTGAIPARSPALSPLSSTRPGRSRSARLHSSARTNPGQPANRGCARLGAQAQCIAADRPRSAAARTLCTLPWNRRGRKPASLHICMTNSLYSGARVRSARISGSPANLITHSARPQHGDSLDLAPRLPLAGRALPPRRRSHPRSAPAPSAPGWVPRALRLGSHRWPLPSPNGTAVGTAGRYPAASAGTKAAALGVPRPVTGSQPVVAE